MSFEILIKLKDFSRRVWLMVLFNCGRTGNPLFIPRNEKDFKINDNLFFS